MDYRRELERIRKEAESLANGQTRTDNEARQLARQVAALAKHLPSIIEGVIRERIAREMPL